MGEKLIKKGKEVDRNITAFALFDIKNNKGMITNNTYDANDLFEIKVNFHNHVQTDSINKYLKYPCNSRIKLLMYKGFLDEWFSEYNSKHASIEDLNNLDLNQVNLNQIKYSDMEKIEGYVPGSVLLKERREILRKYGLSDIVIYHSEASASWLNKNEFGHKYDSMWMQKDFDKMYKIFLDKNPEIKSAFKKIPKPKITKFKPAEDYYNNIIFKNMHKIIDELNSSYFEVKQSIIIPTKFKKPIVLNIGSKPIISKSKYRGKAITEITTFDKNTKFENKSYLKIFKKGSEEFTSLENIQEILGKLPFTYKKRFSPNGEQVFKKKFLKAEYVGDSRLIFENKGLFLRNENGEREFTINIKGKPQLITKNLIKDKLVSKNFRIYEKNGKIEKVFIKKLEFKTTGDEIFDFEKSENPYWLDGKKKKSNVQYLDEKIDLTNDFIKNELSKENKEGYVRQINYVFYKINNEDKVKDVDFENLEDFIDKEGFIYQDGKENKFLVEKDFLIGFKNGDNYFFEHEGKLYSLVDYNCWKENNQIVTKEINEEFYFTENDKDKFDAKLDVNFDSTGIPTQSVLYKRGGALDNILLNEYGYNFSINAHELIKYLWTRKGNEIGNKISKEIINDYLHNFNDEYFESIVFTLTFNKELRKLDLKKYIGMSMDKLRKEDYYLYYYIKNKEHFDKLIESNFGENSNVSSDRKIDLRNYGKSLKKKQQSKKIKNNIPEKFKGELSKLESLTNSNYNKEKFHNVVEETSNSEVPTKVDNFNINDLDEFLSDKMKEEWNTLNKNNSNHIKDVEKLDKEKEVEDDFNKLMEDLNNEDYFNSNETSEENKIKPLPHLNGPPKLKKKDVIYKVKDNQNSTTLKDISNDIKKVVEKKKNE